MKKQIARTLALVLILGVLSGGLLSASAHNVLVESLGGTYLLYSYSDGTLVKGAKIIIQDENGEALGADKTTSEGLYNYAEYEGTAAKIIMNDGEGHVAEYEVPDETPPVTDRTPVEPEGEGTGAPAEESAPPEQPAPVPSSGMSAGTIAAVVVVVVAAVVVALFFSKRGKKK